jgi:hypothetical protein
MTEQAAPIRPTPERIAQGGIVQNPEDRGGRPKPWHSFEAPHDGLLAASLISKQAWEAGSKFREAYETLCGTGVRAGSWERGVDGRRTDFTDRQHQASLDLVRWARKLSEPLYDCLEGIMGLGKSPSRWAADRGEHPACGRIVLIAALEQFALVQ